MAAFSPSPPPHWTTSRLNRPNSPPVIQRSRRPIHYTHDANSVASAMDIDERGSIVTDRSLSRIGGDMLFSKTDEISVSFYANLPLEVKQALRMADFNKDPYSGEIDTLTGFALVTSSKTCFVWQHAQAIKGIPTCYIFACPEDSTTLKPPFHVLVPQGSREPGLILVSAAGQIQFWESIASGLAGGNNYVTWQLENMESDEEVTNLIRIDSQAYILSTSYGRLCRLSLSSSGGKYHLTSRDFGRPNPAHSFSRLFPSFLSTGSSIKKDKSKHIHAVAIGHRSPSGDREIWALANGLVQKWNMTLEGWEDLIFEYNLLVILSEAVEGQSYMYLDVEKGWYDLELSDIAIFDDQHIAILLSYSGKEISNDFRRLYALAVLKPKYGVGFDVVQVTTIPYQTTSSPGPPVHPRMQLLYSGSIISVQFGDAVALCSRGDYRDRLELKSNTDRTLGVGVSSSNNLLLILTATSMMKVSLDLEKINSFELQTGRKTLIKSVMLQAILYGSSPLNPLRFSFAPDINDESLMEAAEELSKAVLNSDLFVIRNTPDMTTQLISRKERLSWLIGFINENAVLHKLSRVSRQTLATDAEQLYAFNELWLMYNDLLSANPSQNLLKSVITAFMAESHDGRHEDVMRAFFRTRVSDISKLLKKVVNTISESPSDLELFLYEANAIVITLLQSAFQYRKCNIGVYGIEPPTSTLWWTSEDMVIEALESLLDFSTKVDFSTRGSNNAIHSQIPELANLMFKSFQEKLDTISAALQEVPNTQLKEDLRLAKQTIYTKVSRSRPDILETLQRCGHPASAFALAEKYRDFPSLVALCHREKVYPAADNPQLDRIQTYIARYQENFTTELFQWYIQHGEVRTLFDPATNSEGHLDKYFRENSNLPVSWIHDLKQRRYNQVAAALLADAEISGNLAGKHLMLSIGKLAYIADVDKTKLYNASALDVFHYELDFVSVHERLVQRFRDALVPSRTRQSLDGQIDTIMQCKCTQIVKRDTFIHIFKDSLRQLLQGRTVPVEDVVDLLTLKDNDESLEDFATSLHLLATVSSKVPEARKYSAIQTVWRRVCLHDNWDMLKQTADVTDEELNSRYKNTALYVTLCSVLQKGECPIMGSPNEVLDTPPAEEIASRWPSISKEQIHSIAVDYKFEENNLRMLELDDIYMRIKELAEAEVYFEM